MEVLVRNKTPLPRDTTSTSLQLRGLWYSETEARDSKDIGTSILYGDVLEEKSGVSAPQLREYLTPCSYYHVI